MKHFPSLFFFIYKKMPLLLNQDLKFHSKRT